MKKQDENEIKEILNIFRAIKFSIRILSKRYVWVPLFLFLFYLYMENPKTNLLSHIINHIMTTSGMK
jgi:hypothetical protein